MDINSLEVIQGQLPRRALTLVQEGAMIHTEELFENRRTCREKTAPAFATVILPTTSHDYSRNSAWVRRYTHGRSLETSLSKTTNLWHCSMFARTDSGIDSLAWISFSSKNTLMRPWPRSSMLLTQLLLRLAGHGPAPLYS